MNLDKYNLHVEKYNGVSLVENKFRVRKESVKIPFFLRNYLYSNFNIRTGYANTAFSLFYLKKTKLLKYIILTNLLYKSVRRYLFFIQIFNKMIRFLNIWYKDKLYLQLNMFKNLIHNKDLNYVFFYNKLKYISGLYKKIYYIYVKYINYKYVNMINSIKKVLESELTIGLVSNKQYKRNLASIVIRFKTLLFKPLNQKQHQVLNLLSDTRNLSISLLKKKFVPVIFKNEKHYLFSNENQTSFRELFNLFLRDYYQLTYRELITILNTFNITSWNGLFYYLESRLNSVLCRIGYTTTFHESKHVITDGNIKINGNVVRNPMFSLLPGSIIEFSHFQRNKNYLNKKIISYYLICNFIKKHHFIKFNIKLVFFKELFNQIASLSKSTLNSYKYSFIRNLRKLIRTPLLEKVVRLHSIFYPILGNVNMNIVISSDKIHFIYTAIYNNIIRVLKLYTYNKLFQFGFHKEKSVSWLRRKYKAKKSMNRYYNKLLKRINKKYGVLFSSFLVQDTISYWISDYNKITIFDVYSHVMKLNQSHYRFNILKYKNTNMTTPHLSLFVKSMMFQIFRNTLYNSLNSFVFTDKIYKKTNYSLMLQPRGINHHILSSYGLQTLPSLTSIK